MYELKLVLIRGCGATSIDHQNIPLLYKMVVSWKDSNFHRGSEWFDEGTSSNPFHEGTSNNPFDKEEMFGSLTIYKLRLTTNEK